MDIKKLIKIKKTKLSIFFFVIMILLTGGFYAFFSVPYWDKSIIWRDIEISGLKLKENGPQYSFINGRLVGNDEDREVKFEWNPQKLIENSLVIRLVAFKQKETLDPLFVSNELQYEEFVKSIDGAISANNKLLETTGYKENLIPVDYFKDLKEISALKNDNQLLSYAADKKLLDIYAKAVDDYLNNAKELESKLISLNYGGKQLIEAGSTSSSDIVMSDLGRVAENGKALKTEVEERRLCLDYGLYCGIKINQTVQKDDVQETGEINILGNDELFYPHDQELLKFYGPYEITTDCWSENKGDSLHYLYEVEENGLRYVPIIATTNYYSEISGNAQDIIDRMYVDHDLDWRNVTVTSTYGCNDLEYQAALSTLAGFDQKYGAPALNKLQVDGLPKMVQDKLAESEGIESAYYGQKIKSQDGLARLGEAYWESYLALVGDNTDWAVKTRSELLDRYLLIKNRLAGYDKVLNYFSFLLNTYSEIYNYNAGDRQNYIYFLRNAYPLTYMTFTPVVWRISEKPQYMVKKDVNIRGDLKNYQQLVAQFGKDYVKKINDITREQIFIDILGHKIN